MVSGAGNLTEAGPGLLTLGAANTFTGTTLVSGGTLTLTNAAALSMSTYNASGAGTLSFGTLATAAFGGLTGASGTLALNNAAATAGVSLQVGATAA